jgi:hypothetical protein
MNELWEAAWVGMARWPLPTLRTIPLYPRLPKLAYTALTSSA